MFDIDPGEDDFDDRDELCFRRDDSRSPMLRCWIAFDGENPLWVTKNGQTLLLRKMSAQHLRNARRMMERNALKAWSGIHCDVTEQSLTWYGFCCFWLEMLRAEEDRRDNRTVRQWFAEGWKRLRR